MKILITGGAGFVGSNLATYFKEDDPKSHVTVLDNLKRRGSELNLRKFKERDIRFVHGDIRNVTDLEDLEGSFDLLIEASAEPSVMAGITGSPNYVLQTNLNGTLNCLEFSRRKVGGFIFLSTSKVYSIDPLRELKYGEDPTRFQLKDGCKGNGVSPLGVSECFPTDRARSMYGATKLASELIIQEYCYAYGLKAIINRCGVITGPGQFGKVDQGIFSLWMVNHVFNKKLQFTGFGGRGKQVRDLLHPWDLYTLIQKQIRQFSDQSEKVFNVGGGRDVSVSLQELTSLCRELTGNRIEIDSVPETSLVDVPIYYTDYSLAHRVFDWRPTLTVKKIYEDLYRWVNQNEGELRYLFS